MNNKNNNKMNNKNNNKMNNKNNNKMKDIENSQLFIQVIVAEGVNQFGRKVIQTKWELANGEVNLGSLAKPNEKIINFKYNVPDDKPLFQKLFGDFK